MQILESPDRKLVPGCPDTSAQMNAQVFSEKTYWVQSELVQSDRTPWLGISLGSFQDQTC